MVWCFFEPRYNILLVFCVESFIVCQNYSPPEGYVPTMANPLLDFHYNGENQLTGPNRMIVPFIACGDLR